MEEFKIQLRNLIPATVSKFPKLTKGEPYHFDHWSDDRSGNDCLYYWFSSADGEKRLRKRINLFELYTALKRIRNAGEFNRDTYSSYCPISASSGPCGFTVMGRILETLGAAKYSGRGKGFKSLKSEDVAQ